MKEWVPELIMATLDAKAVFSEFALKRRDLGVGVGRGGVSSRGCYKGCNKIYKIYKIYKIKRE